jgi:hypothetical protein
MPKALIRILSNCCHDQKEPNQPLLTSLPFGIKLKKAVEDLGIYNSTSATVCYPETSDAADC